MFTCALPFARVLLGTVVFMVAENPDLFIVHPEAKDDMARYTLPSLSLSLSFSLFLSFSLSLSLSLSLYLSSQPLSHRSHPNDALLHFSLSLSLSLSLFSLIMCSKRFFGICSQLLECMETRMDCAPPLLLVILSMLKDTVASLYPDSALRCVGGFFFLRFFCPGSSLLFFSFSLSLSP